MPPYAMTDLVTTGGEHEVRIPKNTSAGETNATRGFRTLHDRVQAIET